jgi:2-methylcitrate dehydratase PrpD
LIPPQGIGVVCEPDAVKRHPVEPYAAKFSAQYVLASALLDGVIGPQSFTDAAILRDDVHAYTDRVSFLAHDFGVAGAFTYPGGVELHLNDGRTIRRELPAPHPMDRSAIETKLADCARLAGFDALRIAETVDKEHDARLLVASLVRSPSAPSTTDPQ